MPIQKLYVYVDETGQETEGQLFLVSIILSGPERDQLRAFLTQAEQTTGKNLKWHHSPFAVRVAYLRQVLPHPFLQGNILYAVYRQTVRPYVELTTDAVARAVATKQGRHAKLTVIIDGLNQAEVRRVGAGLRQRGLWVRKVRGLRDESDAILRLADAMAGFLRDLTEGRPYAQQLYTQLQLGSVVLQV